jgi:hypothetical protein
MNPFKRFLTVVLSLAVVAVLVIPLAGPSVSAQSGAPCTPQLAVSSLAPEWAATRQQYETTYRPATQVPQTAIALVAAMPPLAPEWVALRQQYETTYQPVAADCLQLQTACSALAPRWVAVRQQYERNYVPSC